MTLPLSTECRLILERAADESRKLRHGYIGTEHLLLALLADPTILEKLYDFRLSPEDIRAQIDSLVHPGRDDTSAGAPPLTPRARRAIEIASAEAHFASQGQVTPAHLFLGLFLEAEGVAGAVLRNVSPALDVQSLRKEIFRIRLARLRLIERTVRPVRAGIPRKLKMREELLAHLESIYAEELNRLHDADAALAESAQRFGNPIDLTRELQSTVPAHERVSHLLEKQFGWRAPEHASKYLRRLTLQFLGIFGIAFAVFAAVVIAVDGLIPSTIFILYPAVLLLLATAASLYLLGNLYFLTRDALFGVFGSPKSKARVAVLAAVTFATTLGIGAAYTTARTGSLYALAQTIPGLALAATAATLTSFLYARLRGPREIQQTHWECLNLDTN